MRETMKNALFVWFVPIFSLGLVLLTSGCGHRQSIADKRYYHQRPALDWVVPASDQRDAPLYIPRAQALGVVGSRPILVKTGDGSLMQLHHHLWIDSPRVLWQNAALDWSDRTRLWPTVYDVRPAHATHYTLLLTLLALEKDADRATLGLRAELIDPTRNMIYQESFKLSRPIPGNTVAGFVGTIDALSGEIWRQLDAGIRQALLTGKRSHD